MVVVVVVEEGGPHTPDVIEKHLKRHFAVAEGTQLHNSAPSQNQTSSGKGFSLTVLCVLKVFYC